MNKLVLLPALAFTAAGSLMSAHAAESSPPAGDGASALTVSRDPATGRLRAPTHEEARNLANPGQGQAAGARTLRGAPALTAQPLMRRHAGGAASVRLSDEMTSQVVAVRGADGKVDTACHDNRTAAMAFAKRPAPGAATE